MKTNLLIPEKTLFFLALFGAVFTIFTVAFDFTSIGIPLEAGKIITSVALICSFITAIVLIIDVFKNNIPGKYLWTLGLLLTGGIAGILYLSNRSKYIA